MKRHAGNTLLTRLMLLTTAVTLIAVIIAASVSYANLNGEIKVANESYYLKRFENACGLLDRRFFSTHDFCQIRNCNPKELEGHPCCVIRSAFIPNTDPGHPYNAEAKT